MEINMKWSENWGRGRMDYRESIREFSKVMKWSA